MAITAGLVKELRERTGAGMMECKRALVDAGGDLEAAIETMRKSGQAKADKKAGRVAAEGLIAIELDAAKKAGAMVEVNCETDFVAKEDGFRAFVGDVAKQVLRQQPADLVALSAISIAEGGDETVEDRRKELVAKIGENITVRRFTRMESQDGLLGAYLHAGRIGVLVELTGANQALAKDIAMHVAASRPICIGESDIPKDVLEKEKEIFMAQAAGSGKSREIIEKMVGGRLKKYLSEVTLLGQSFVKDTDMSVEKYLAKSDATVLSFQRFEVGEGIEKRSENFADEVMAQVRDSEPDSRESE